MWPKLPGTTPGEVERYNMQRVVSLTANIARQAAGRCGAHPRRHRRAGKPPPRSDGERAGTNTAARRNLEGLRIGLLLSIGHLPATDGELPIDSARVGGAFDGAGRAVRRRADAARHGDTLNVQSFMGAIMAIGVAVANAILLVTFAEIAGARAPSRSKRRWKAGAAACAPS